MRAVRRLNREQLILAALGLAWLGLWGAWIPDVAASLNQNVFTLAEWSTFLTDVRYGGLRLAPDLLRLSAALGITAGMISLRLIPDVRLRWAARVTAAVPVGLILLPPYPDVLQLWWSASYGLRFTVSFLLGVGFAATWLLDRVSAFARRMLAGLLCLLAIIAATGGYSLLLPPYLAHYAAPLTPGWGLIVFDGGLLAACALLLYGLSSGQRVTKQNGPDA